MEIEYDITKSNKNFKERGLSFELAHNFEWDDAVYTIDFRQIKKELRFNSIGYIGKRLFFITCTLRANFIRIISLRKANKREVDKYAKT